MISDAPFQIEIDEESDYTTRFYHTHPSTGLPIDITGYRAEMQARQNYNGQSNLERILTYSTDTGHIILGGAAGTIDLIIPYTDTANLLWQTGVYDLFLYNPAGIRRKFIKGFITVNASVTKFSQSSLVDISAEETPPFEHPNNFGAGATDAPDPEEG